MKISVNRNTIWCDLFVNRLIEYGVKYACISPGSRSTPLTLAFSQNKSIKLFQIVDERSSAFFALGLAKKSKSPVAIVTTSGTAVAELYPAIIEAFYQRIPLIVCTADRPHYLRNTGANQTINQDNIFRNHIRYFADVGLPDVNLKSLSSLIKKTDTALNIALIENVGPIHLNFQFEKPFEPDTYTEKIDVNYINKIYSLFNKIDFKERKETTSIDKVLKKLTHFEKGLIIVGYNNYDNQFSNLCARLSSKLKYPVFADASSGLRCCNHSQKNVIENFTSLIRSKNYKKEFDPEIIIQFGGTPTSNIVQNFFKESKAEKIIVNEFGDKNDPSLTARTILKIKPEEFCQLILEKINLQKLTRRQDWFEKNIKLNEIAETIKRREFQKEEINFEGKIIYELYNLLPSKSNLMISNSLPIRDADFFVSCTNKQINIFSNRGASGIDGINSTALGIAKLSKEPTVLVTGDLAFYHDMNGLHNAIKFNIPLTIVLINNNGGGIFESLPISRYGKTYIQNFVTPLDIDFSKFVEAYGGKHYLISNFNEFKMKLDESLKSRKLSVLEIRTNAKESKLIREKIWRSITSAIDLYLNENKSRSN
ncbi:2-succinyl-5-enolpyruvyl-6-hydroxy-3-cyclohexene-1-carboxylic-acid synthase [Rosettibacter firmus]|uniref:2-succinyl-5-enolpyruvyl-6-hydroxy-3- cyclohexene-1-carboxylic-acid synthase n=1 Tax=Rosettibacter firmus TaxID=3111522 RepID=UPI00336BDFB5